MTRPLIRGRILPICSSNTSVSHVFPLGRVEEDHLHDSLLSYRMDSNIDPAIESQAGIFTKFELNSDYNNNTDTDAFISQSQGNFQYNISEHNQSQSTEVANQAVAAAATAQAAANLSNIIHFTPLDHERQNSSHREHNQDQLSFLHSALQMEARHPNRGNVQEQHAQESTTQPKQVLIQDPSSQMSIVVVDPSSVDGASRLGRPRKHQVKIPGNFQDSSSKNLEESLLSRFRVDAKPISGPGSRGGRKNKPKPVTKQPVFAKNGNSLTMVMPADHPKNEYEANNLVESVENTTIILEDINSLKAKGRSTLSDEKVLQSQSSSGKVGSVPLVPLAVKPPHHKDTSISSTAPPKPLRRRTKKRRDIPGPITGAFYDLYDTDVVMAHEQEELNLVALGYGIKPSPYAKDIIAILSFYNKFKKFFKNVPNLGPQDLEEGLKLPQPEPYKVSNASQLTPILPYDSAYQNVSELVNQFFFQLLYLLMNKKRPVTQANLAKTLDEFKAQVLVYGLPAEWRDDSGVVAAPLVDASLLDPEDTTPIDPTHSEMFDTTQYQFGTCRPLEHTPLDNADFEELGLKSLQPLERLLLLRSIVQWCTSYSDSIRGDITKQLSKQDSSGDKETYYISRFIKEGEKGVEHANVSLKLHPRKKVRKAEGNILLDPYTDATANPLDHHMSLRIMDFYAGDLGVNGRFFLCRSCDEDTGGLSSLTQMKSVLESPDSITDMLSLVQPSRFKLYVHDVSTMLESVSSDGGLSDQSQSLDPWYEVASNVEELRAFTYYLQDKLAVVKTPEFENLVNYLVQVTPMLEKFESIQRDYRGLTTRQPRKREQVLDIKEAASKVRIVSKEPSQPADEFLNEGTDTEEGGEEVDEDFDAEGAEPEDDDDDDYRD